MKWAHQDLDLDPKSSFFRLKKKMISFILSYCDHRKGSYPFFVASNTARR